MERRTFSRLEIVFSFAAAVALLAFTANCTGRGTSDGQKSAVQTCAGSDIMERHVTQPVYDSCFTEGRMRIDLTFAGNAYEQEVYLNKLAAEKKWSGSKRYLIDTLYYGEYRLEIEDTTGRPLFGMGFNTLFQEWRTLEEAERENLAFCSSYRVPFPKEKVMLVIYERVQETGKFREFYRSIIDPDDKSISRDSENDFKVTPVIVNGEPSEKVDLLFIAEGYTSSQMEKFRKDVEKFTEYLFDIEPYKSRSKDFNIWAVESVSDEEGTDIPHEGIWRRTVAGSNFYTFKSDRYLTAPDQTVVAKLAANAPCDAMYVIVNTSKYGGGGIYNYYGLSMSDHKTEAQVFVHEFGHSFAGLADEYFYEGDVFENSFYNLNLEPWEPNITTLIDFRRKWATMLNPSTPVPTPADSSNIHTIGVYEGAAYCAKGIYRPYIDCRMRSNAAPGFCPVCQSAINRMIDNYIK